MTNDFYRFDYDKGRLNEGWNILSFDFTSAPTDSLGTSNGSFNPATISTMQIVANFTASSFTSEPTLYFDRLHLRDAGTPTTALAQNETIIDDFEDADLTVPWTETPSGSTNTTQNETVLFQDGAKSLRVNKVDQTTNEVGAEATAAADMPYDLTTGNPTGIVSFWAYIPSPGNLNSGAAMRVRFGS